MGHPKYEITKGEIIYNGQVINDMPPNERAKLGLFLSFQYPSEVSGVTISSFLRTALNSKLEEHISVLDFHELLKEKMEDNGFKVYKFEWWHFDFNDWKSYRIGNISFKKIK